MPVHRLTIATPEQPLTVSELNLKARLLLEKHLATIEVTGEIANLARPQSGHLYFKLRDANAQVQCAMFRSQARQLSVTLADGMAVTVHAAVSLYEPRGDYQLIVQQCRPSGEGALRQQFEQLKQQLAKAGLFDDTHKQTPPFLPKCVGLITSDSGAALHDMLTTLKRRFAAIPLLLFPTAVQGIDAAKQIASQIAAANHHGQAEVLLLARGGGSLEDLWPFNTPEVAHAIFGSRIPIITGVGHEPDMTIADYCADLRGATPTAAATLACPDASTLLRQVSEQRQRVLQALHQQHRYQQRRLSQLSQRLATPQRLIEQRMRYTDGLAQRLYVAIQQYHQRHQQRLHRLQQQLWQYSPRDQYQQHQLRLQQLNQRLSEHVQSLLHYSQQRFQRLSATLQATSPLRTLGRGYSLVYDQHQQLVSDVSQVQRGDNLTLTLHHGRLRCDVKDKLS